MDPRFPETEWNVVVESQSLADSRARQALSYLCERYWYPIYAFVRRRGHNEDQAREITQAFFTHLLEKGTLARADPARGKFRSFLLGTLKGFLSDRSKWERAAKRMPEQGLVSLDAQLAEQRYRHEPADRLTPEAVYEQRWAGVVLDRALGRLGEEQRSAGKSRQFATLQGYLTEAESVPPYAEVARELGMSVSAVKVAVHRLRQRFGVCLRDEIQPTLANPEWIDEVRYILRSARAFGVRLPAE